MASAWRSDFGTAVRRGLLSGLALLALVLPSPGPIDGALRASAGPAVPRAPRGADFGSAAPGPDARELADWIADSQDNAGLAFVILDKRRATLFVFDPQARLLGTSAVLLGAAVGDDSVAGIGARPVALVQPHERTTPAGRFVGERGRNANREDVIWVDYDAAVSMHRLRSTDASERRAERLATPSADDNRISYGCINVPVAFYETHIHPLFADRPAVVYVMPELKAMQTVFGVPDRIDSGRANATSSADFAAQPSQPDRAQPARVAAR